MGHAGAATAAGNLFLFTLFGVCVMRVSRKVGTARKIPSWESSYVIEGKLDLFENLLCLRGMKNDRHVEHHRGDQTSGHRFEGQT